MKDQWDCVLNDLEEVGDKEFLLVLTNQYTSASCHFTLPHYIRSNVENAQNRSEDNPLISRIQSLHHLLEVDDNDEEEYSVIVTLEKRHANQFLAQHQSKIFHR